MTSLAPTPSLMIQGTGSDVGKSFLVAGLARALANRGLKVAPFKPQNMSNNAAVVATGEDGDGQAGEGEIGRAQWVQALAARVAPTVHMNPVLLKPQSDRTAQVIVQGRRHDTLDALPYQQRKGALLGHVLDSFERLKASADIVLVEGAGSPAEVNLRAGDIANMGFARAAGVPVILAGDIDRGGVIAALVGTHAVVDPADAAMIRGFLINRFRGDVSLFDDGLTFIERRTGWPGFGVLPHLDAARRLPAEDAVVLERPQAGGAGRRLTVAAPMLSRIANFDDLDPLKADPGVDVVFVPPGEAIPPADLIVLLGTKATVADLDFLRAQGWDVDIAAHVRQGGRVLGICGGFQMLGRRVADAEGQEGAAGERPGLGLLDIDTEMAADKTVRTVRGHWTPPAGAPDRPADAPLAVDGYEIHMGQTRGPGLDRPLLTLDGRAHGAVSADGRVMGCYLHGLFTADGFRQRFLETLGLPAGAAAGSYTQALDAALDSIAEAFERHLDVDGLLAVARAGVGAPATAPTNGAADAPGAP
ncbi:cobyric acid synthase CobQ [Rhodothalassium salexigens]|uniref:cobyric acid synthase n=1 Tax=Rhodothalassium salexigens TaxID=1086 RepID=UPI001913490A|nr:cobyric acid synthase [Rhodothalassium salexigens]MBK5910712.1 cobyric acid synthase CobQ [Rhodothalassium salexigens]MBK5921658.1 cobyric acid synthase CobQ [Rhodothalassium salexigens]